MNYPIKSITIEKKSDLMKAGFKWGDKFKEATQIPFLAVISGINGSGKTRLLEWIFRNLVTINSQNNLAENELNQNNVFYKKVQGEVANADININLLRANEVIKQFEISTSERFSNINLFSNNDIWNDNDIKKLFAAFLKESFYRSGFSNFTENDICDQIKDFSKKEDYLNFLKEERDKNDFNMINIIKRIGELIRKDIVHVNDLYVQQKRSKDNAQHHDYIYEEINKIISEIKSDSNQKNQQFFKHTIKKPKDLANNDDYKLTFVKKGDEETEISFDGLSSGEKVIFELLCYKYLLSNEKYKNHQPKVILLDEFDSNLNPALAKVFIDTITNQFIKNGIQVIMTTHSPSTIAYVPEDSLFWMEDGKIEKKEKMEIIRDLSSGFLTGFEKFKDGYALTYFTDPTKKFYFFVEGWLDVLHFKSACKKFEDGKYNHILKKCNLIQMTGIKDTKLTITMLDNFYNSKKISCEKIIAVFDNDTEGNTCYDAVKDKFKPEKPPKRKIEPPKPKIKLLKLPAKHIERMYDDSLLKKYFSCDQGGQLKEEVDKYGNKNLKPRKGKGKRAMAIASADFKPEDFKKFAEILEEISTFISSN